MESDKSAIRRTLQATLRETSATDRAAWSESIRSHLLASPAWPQARTVMLFAALRDEPDLLPLIGNTPEKTLALPSMQGDLIVPRQVHTPGDLQTASWGFREPVPALCPEIDPPSIDLILIPGLGFDLHGTRLGRGKGHYDRFLTTLSPAALRCGVCFHCQIHDTLPAESHDIPVSALLTENGWTTIR